MTNGVWTAMRIYYSSLTQQEKEIYLRYFFLLLHYESRYRSRWRDSVRTLPSTCFCLLRSRCLWRGRLAASAAELPHPIGSQIRPLMLWHLLPWQKHPSLLHHNQRKKIKTSCFFFLPLLIFCRLNNAAVLFYIAAEPHYIHIYWLYLYTGNDSASTSSVLWRRVYCVYKASFTNYECPSVRWGNKASISCDSSAAAASARASLRFLSASPSRPGAVRA